MRDLGRRLVVVRVAKQEVGAADEQQDRPQAGHQIRKVAEEAERQGIVIYSVGIGSPKGEPIPAAKTGGSNGGFKKDKKGQVVITKLDEVTLEKIALQTGGKYYRATSGQEELDRIYEDVAKMEKKELGSMQFSQFEDRFQYIIIFAIILLIVEFLISEKKSVKREWRGRFM